MCDHVYMTCTVYEQTFIWEMERIVVMAAKHSILSFYIVSEKPVDIGFQEGLGQFPTKFEVTEPGLQSPKHDLFSNTNIAFYA